MLKSAPFTPDPVPPDPVPALLNPGEEDPFRSTFGMSIHLLMPGKRFFEWSLTADTIGTTAVAIIDSFERYGLPFFDAYTTIKSVNDRLNSINPSDWIMMTPTRRAEVLAACYYLLDEREAGKAFVERQLEINRDKYLKYRLPLEHLLRTIFASGTGGAV